MRLVPPNRCAVLLSVIVALLTSFVTNTAHAQATCGNLLAAGPTISPISGSRVVVGQTVTITTYRAASVVGNCLFRDGDGFMAYPNGTVVQTMDAFSLDPGDVRDCTGPAGNTIGACQAFTTSYTVAAADVNRTLTIAMPPRGQFDGGSEIYLGQPNQIHFLGAANVDGFDPAQPASATGAATGSGRQLLVVVRPCITITKECVNACTPFGAPIQFRGRICNTGNTRLGSIALSDSPAATTSFAATTSGGRPFDAAAPDALLPGECVDYTGSYQPAGAGAALCGPFTDTITVTARATSDSAGNIIVGTPPVTNTDPCYDENFVSSGPRPPVTATCNVCNNPCIDATKTCPSTVAAGSTSIPFSGIVTNCGNVPLTNVRVVDDNGTPGNAADDITITLPDIPVGGSVPYSGTHTIAAGFCGPFTDRIVASGTSVCGGAVNSPARSCTTEVPCPPQICIVKQVACSPPGATCDGNLSYGETATGVANSADPAFCYRITVSNCGQDVLNNVTVTDPDIPAVAGAFPTTLAIGESVTRYFQKTWPVGTHVNTATARGVGASSRAQVSTNDSATAIVLLINIVCELTLSSSFDMDNNPNNNTVTLPAGSTATPVRFNFTLRNTGTSPLNVTSLDGLPALVDCDSGAPVVVPLPINIAPGGSYLITGCVLVSCPGAQYSVTAHAEADDQGGTLCVYDSQGRRIVDDTSPCTANVNCETPTTCRVTGGGVLLPDFTDQSCTVVNTAIIPFTSPNGLSIRKITHGGQLGAPFSHMDCGERLGNPCIRGEWSHTRHYEGKANPRDVFEMNFHSQTPKGQYDSLLCACLGCCDPVTGAFISPITIGGICNPDDHKICGPMPRPSPANAIIWSGIGKVTPVDDVRGSRAAQAEWVIFRVYIEDRSEPGGGHPGGAVEPADIYCFQAWKTGIKVAKKPDFSTVEPALRTALGKANCDFLTALQNGTLTIGTLPSPTIGERTADIQDCGPLHDGNHQIHPATGATCVE
jgi:hypothetical protein